MENPPVPPREIKPYVPTIAEHDRPFRLPFGGRSGKQATFEKFPEHVPDPPKELKKKAVDPDADDKPGFKLTHKYKSRPQASVALNVRNLKAAYPSMFRSVGRSPR